MYAWDKKLRINNYEGSNTPVEISFFNDKKILSLYGNGYHYFAFTTEGIYGWGDNKYKQLENREEDSYSHPHLISFKKIPGSKTSSFKITNNGNQTLRYSINVAEDLFSFVSIKGNLEGNLETGESSSFAVATLLSSKEKQKINGEFFVISSNDGQAEKINLPILINHKKDSNLTDFYVSKQGSNEGGDGSRQFPFRTIQHAINQASDSTKIRISDGEYFENLSIEGKILHLIGNRNNPEKVIINGFLNQESTLKIENIQAGAENKILLEGLSVINGSGSNTRMGGSYKISHSGGGILINNVSFLDLENTFIEGNKAIGNNTNSSYISEAGWGGGIAIIQSQNINLDKLNIAYNKSAYVGGIYTLRSDSVISNSQIHHNKARENTGGVSNSSSDMLINKTDVYENQGNYTGEIHNAGSLKIQNSNIYEKEASSTYILANYKANILKIFNSNIYGTSPMHNLGQLNINYSNITLDSSQNYEGEGNLLEQDPKFRDPQNGNFYLKADSPCIDAGIAKYPADSGVDLNLAADTYLGESPDIGSREYAIFYADFSSSDAENVVQLENINFKNLTNLEWAPEEIDLSLVSYEWDFGDGNTHMQENKNNNISVTIHPHQLL